MPINPKLEFYRFELNPKGGSFKSFRDFAIDELRAGRNPNDKKVLTLCLKHFITSLTGEHANSKQLKKKLSFEKKPAINLHYEKGPKHNTGDHTISGVICGGPYGRDIIILNNDDDKDSMRLDRNKTVSSYYFFYLYLPPDHNEGFFMIHSNSKEESITVLFRTFITSIFKGANYNKAQPQEFCPEEFQKEFKNHSILKSIVFKTSFVDNIPNTDGISGGFQGYDIKIIATPKNKDIKGEDSPGFMDKMKKKLFGRKDDERPLENFEDRQVVLENDITGSKKTFEWNEKDNDFVPVVYLEGRVKMKNADGTPDFLELEEFCTKLFKDKILKEIRPDLGDVTRAE